jgi:hypothetical protein
MLIRVFGHMENILVYFGLLQVFYLFLDYVKGKKKERNVEFDYNKFFVEDFNFGIHFIQYGQHVLVEMLV